MPRAGRREERAPVDRARRSAGGMQRGRLGRPGAGRGARCPARCPSPRPAAGRCRVVPASASISVEEVGVAGEVDTATRGFAACARANLEADRLRLRPGQRPTPGLVVGRDGRNLDLAHLRRLAGGQLDHALEARPAQPRAGAPGDDQPWIAADRAQRGQVEVVAVQMGDEDGVDPLHHLARRRGRVPAQMQQTVAQHGVGEQPDTPELDQNGRVSDECQTMLGAAHGHRITPYG